MRTLQTQATQWMTVLPETIDALERTADKIKDPMFRFFEREVNLGIQFLKTVC